MPKYKVSDENYAVYETSYFKLIKLNDGRGYYQGYVKSKHGAVLVWGNHPNSEEKWTHLEIVHNGRNFRRNIDHNFTQRGLSRKAKEFAREVVGECL